MNDAESHTLITVGLRVLKAMHVEKYDTELYEF
jgi:hypothetical protein